MPCANLTIFARSETVYSHSRLYILVGAVGGMGSRERLIEAMSDLMWERGYAATSPRDVLERAGVGQGSMYHYFKGKHEFAAETLARVAAEIEGQAVPVDGDDSPLDRLKQHLLQPRPGTRGCRIGRMTQDPDVFADAELIGIIDGTFRSVLERWERVIEEAIDRTSVV